MRKESSLPVRLEPEISARLESASKRLGLNKSVLVRLMVSAFLEEYESGGRKIELPLKFRSDSALLAANGHGEYRVRNNRDRGRKDER